MATARCFNDVSVFEFGTKFGDGTAPLVGSGGKGGADDDGPLGNDGGPCWCDDPVVLKYEEKKTLNSVMFQP